VVFVIDCNDKQRIPLAKQELLNLSEKIGRSTSIPIIIAANKQDLSSLLKMFFFLIYYLILYFLESLGKEELTLALSLPKIKSNEWKIFELSALTGKSYSIKKKLKKIFNYLYRWWCYGNVLLFISIDSYSSIDK
jgi:hypothetical protein